MNMQLKSMVNHYNFLLKEFIIGILLPAAVVWLALRYEIYNVIILSALVWAAMKLFFMYEGFLNQRERQLTLNEFLNELEKEKK